MKSKATTDNYKMKDGVELKGQADMIESDVIMIFRSIEEFPESPLASDILYLNACMWIFDKIEGIITYITRDGKEDSFVVNRNQKMFEEVVRRAMVLHDLLKIEFVKEAKGTFGYYDILVKIEAESKKEMERIITKKNKKS